MGWLFPQKGPGQFRNMPKKKKSGKGKKGGKGKKKSKNQKK